MPRLWKRVQPVLIVSVVTVIAIVAGILLYVTLSHDESQVAVDALTIGVEPLSSVNAGKLTLYSGRGENLVSPLIKKFEKETGIVVKVRYGATAPLALAIIEEGKNSPADLYWSQDAGSLGALSRRDRLQKIPGRILENVDARFRSSVDEWVGITGRARVVDYNTQLVNSSDLPDSIWGFLDPGWKGKIGWAPENGSFQAFVSAFRKLEGEDRTREFLAGIMANEPQVYPGNSPIVAALGRGEIDVGLVNNYYLHRFRDIDPLFPVAHHYTKGDAGSMINVAGLAVLDTAKDRELAESFIEYMLSQNAQLYFSTETYEYPLLDGMEAPGAQMALEDIDTPTLDLSDIDDLRGTLELLKEAGVL